MMGPTLLGIPLSRLVKFRVLLMAQEPRKLTEAMLNIAIEALGIKVPPTVAAKVFALVQDRGAGFSNLYDMLQDEDVQSAVNALASPAQPERTRWVSVRCPRCRNPFRARAGTIPARAGFPLSKLMGFKNLLVRQQGPAITSELFMNVFEMLGIEVTAEKMGDLQSMVLSRRSAHKNMYELLLDAEVREAIDAAITHPAWPTEATVRARCPRCANLFRVSRTLELPQPGSVLLDAAMEQTP